MAHLRNATPDSEALGSSDDDGHPINRSISSLRSAPNRRGSWMSEVQPRKQSFTGSLSSNQSKPTTPAGDTAPWPSAHAFGSKPAVSNPLIGGSNIWSSTFSKENTAPSAASASSYRQQKGVDTTTSAKRHAEREVGQAQAGAPFEHSALPVTIDLQPTPKATRSSSYSYGQQERKAVGPILGTDLSQVTEEVDDGYSSDEGAGSNPLFWPAGEVTSSASSFQAPLHDVHNNNHFPFPLTSNNSNNINNNSYNQPSIQQEEDYDMATMQEIINRRYQERDEGRVRSALTDAGLLRSMELPSISNLGNTSHHNIWSSGLGFGELNNPIESRRHSLADIPTRRNSLSSPSGDIRNGNVPPAGGRTNGEGGSAYHTNYAGFPNQVATSQMRPISATSGGMDRYPNAPGEPHVPNPLNLYNPTGALYGGRKLFAVSFKCSRVEIYFLLDDTGLEIKEGDIVIVEADRGQDLGTVQHANISALEARQLKSRYREEQYKWLMMFSQHNIAGNVNPNENSGAAGPVQMVYRPGTSMPGPPRSDNHDLKPKAIKRLATRHEIEQLRHKEGNEAKAKRTCQAKVADMSMAMEILDAEWQWDFQKLIFYYYANHYIDFKPLVGDLFKIYKVRIWMSAVNPASFSSHVTRQPPSGFGPGAIVSPTQDTSYTMAYGADPDPYGAVPPYHAPNSPFGLYPAGYQGTAVSNDRNFILSAPAPTSAIQMPSVGQNFSNGVGYNHFGMPYTTPTPTAGASATSSMPAPPNSYAQPTGNASYAPGQLGRFPAARTAAYGINGDGASPLRNGVDGSSTSGASQRAGTNGTPWPEFHPQRQLQPPIGTRGSISVHSSNSGAGATTNGGFSDNLRAQLQNLSFGAAPTANGNDR